MPRFENPPYYITAYGLAVKRGFKGTLDEWIASLKGEKGDQGERGPQGESGDTPYIGQNGNWWVGEADTGFAVSAKPDLNQNDESAVDYVKNRTHYTITEGFDIAWDGNTEGIDTFVETDLFPSGVFYRVSDMVLSNEVLQNTQMVFEGIQNGVTTTTIANTSEIWDSLVSTGHVTDEYVNLQYVVVTRKDDVTLRGASSPETEVTFPKAGIYFLYASSDILLFCVKKLSATEAVKQLEDKYIPDTIARVGHAHSWNDLKDRPFYEEAAYEVNYTWGGENPTYDDPAIYRVSEEVPALEVLMGGEVLVTKLAGGSGAAEAVIIDEYSVVTIEGGVCYGVQLNEDMVAYIVYDTWNDVEKGLYLARIADDTWASSLTYTAETALKQLDEKFIPDSVLLSGEEKQIILTLFKNIAYTSDMSAKVAELEALWGGSGGDSGGDDTGGGDTPPEDTTDPIEKYTVTNNLTNVTTDNDVQSIEGGKMYTANLTAEDGYTIESVVVTMGGVEINAYGDGVISIDSVTGDIVITATATQMDTGAPVYQLASEQVFDGSAEHDTGYALWGGANEDFTICLDFTDAATLKSTYPMYIKGETFTAAYLWLAKTYNGGAFNARYNSGSNTAIGIANNAEHGKIVVTHVAGETGITVYTASGNYPLASSSNYPTNETATIKLGANGFTGTVHDFKVYDRVLVTDEINTYLGV